MGQFNIAEVLESNAQEISVVLILLGIIFLVNGSRLIAPALGLALGALAGVTINAILLQFADQLPLEENQMLGVSIAVGAVIFLVIRRLVSRIHMLIGGVLGAAITSIVLPIVAPMAGIELSFLMKAIVVDFGFLIGTRMLKGDGDTFAIMISSAIGSIFVVQGGLVLLGRISNPAAFSLEVQRAIAIFVLLAIGTAGQMRMKWRREDTEDADDWDEWEDEDGEGYDEEYDEPAPTDPSQRPPMPQRGGHPGSDQPHGASHGGMPAAQRMPARRGGRPMEMASRPPVEFSDESYADHGRPQHARQQEAGVEVRRRAGVRQFSFDD